MKALRCSLLSLSLLSGCMGSLGADGNGGGSGGGAGGGTGVQLPPDAGLPCEVAQLLSGECASCHGSPLAGGAPMTLLTRADLLAASPRDPLQNQAQRSLARMRDPSSPMAPGGAPATAAVDAFAAWVAAGLPEGSCTPVGPPVLTCNSNLSQPMPTLADEHGSQNMAPGLACIACHSGMNFENQNPGGLSNRGDLYQFMGSVFTAPHERDLCAPRLGAAASVEILDLNDAVVARLNVNGGGNFFGSVLSGRPASYKARVVTAQGTRSMVGAQTSGDCNTCHTAEGLQGAPGRIYLP